MIDKLYRHRERANRRNSNVATPAAMMDPRTKDAKGVVVGFSFVSRGGVLTI